MRPLDYRRQTVLITGASSGLGAEFARRFADRGSDLVLVARRADRLEALASELTRRHGITATILPLDLSRPGAGEELARRARDRGVRVTSLVNNAGFANTGSVHTIDPERLRAEVALDVGAVVDVTRAFLPTLREGDGFLVNLASVAAYQPIPDMAVYAASKAFVLRFTEALWAESKGTGLRVLALAPGPTETEFFDIAGQHASAGLPRTDAASVVEAAIRALDRRNPPLTVVPGRTNRVMSVAGHVTPRRLLTQAVQSGMRRSAAKNAGS